MQTYQLTFEDFLYRIFTIKDTNLYKVVDSNTGKTLFHSDTQPFISDVGKECFLIAMYNVTKDKLK